MDIHHRIGKTHELEKDWCAHRRDEVNPRVRMGRIFLDKVKEDDGVGVDRDKAIQDVQDGHCQRLQRRRR